MIHDVECGKIFSFQFQLLRAKPKTGLKLYHNMDFKENQHGMNTQAVYVAS